MSLTPQSLPRRVQSLLKPVQRWLNPARDRLQKDPFARLQNVSEVAIAASMGIYIDVNQATIDDWLRLPGLSIHQARTLTTLTQSGVAFYCVEDIAAALGIPAARMAPLGPVLRFCYYEPPAIVWLNRATLPQLLTLPQLTPALAHRIIRERQRLPFKDWGDVHQRLGLSPDQTARWMHYGRV